MQLHEHAPMHPARWHAQLLRCSVLYFFSCPKCNPNLLLICLAAKRITWLEDSDGLRDPMSHLWVIPKEPRNSSYHLSPNSLFCILRTIHPRFPSMSQLLCSTSILLLTGGKLTIHSTEMFFIAQCSIALFWFKGEFAGVNKRTRIIKNPSGSRNLNLDKIIPKCIRLLSIIQSKNNTQLNLHREENCYRKQKYDFRIPLSFTPFFPPLHFPVLEAEIRGVILVLVHLLKISLLTQQHFLFT